MNRKILLTILFLCALFGPTICSAAPTEWEDELQLKAALSQARRDIYSAHSSKDYIELKKILRTSQKKNFSDLAFLQDKQGNTALTLAARNCWDQSVSFLLNYGAAREKQQLYKPLSQAMQHNCLNSAALLVNYSIKRRFKLDDYHWNDLLNQTISHAFTTHDLINVPFVINVLLKANIETNTPRSALYTTILLAPNAGTRKQVAHSLLQRGANPSYRDEHGHVPYLEALKNSQYEVVQLMEDFDPSLIKKYAAESFLHYAQYQPSIATFAYLLNQGSSVNVQDTNGTTPLMGVCKSQESADLISTYLEYLLRQGANPNLQDSQGMTAMMYCAPHKLDYLFLQYGADLAIQDKSGRTVEDWRTSPVL